MAKCYVTGFACVHDEGHTGPHKTRAGLEWGGEICDHRHIFWPHQTTCRCGEVIRDENDQSRRV